jgi:hypothetical protein
MPNPSDIYAAILNSLTAARQLMLTAAWQSTVPDDLRPAAGQALVDVQQAILALSNASLSDIANYMQTSADALSQQAAALNAEVAKVNEVKGVIDTAAKIVSTISTIIPLL